MARRFRRWEDTRRVLSRLAFGTIIVSVLGTANADAATTVTGSQDTNAPLEITPVDDPHTAALDVWSSADRIAYIQEMPVTKTITRVTLGDLASDPSCTSEAQLGLWIRHFPLGERASDTGNHLASALAKRPIPMTLSQVTWEFNPVTLKRGENYAFLLSGVTTWGTCSKLQQRTWAHNQPTVNGGDQACVRAPEMGVSGRDGFNLTPKRMWHVRGAADNDPYCARAGGTSSHPDFDPDMPGGWIRANTYCYGHCPKVDIEHSYPQHSNPEYREPNCNIIGDSSAGFASRRWRDLDPSVTGQPTTQWVCDWAQFGPKGERVPDGWYWGLPWRWEKGALPRDVYLRLDTIDYEALLYRYAPEYRYDNDELFHAMSVNSITDFYVDSGLIGDSNALKGTENLPEEIALANPILVPPLGPFPADLLTVGYLASSYPSGGASARAGGEALESDFLSERGNHSDTAADDARVLQGDPSGRYVGKIYGHVAADSDGRAWLQYFSFYYYNPQDAFGIGSHEGDWESVQVRLDHNLQPDLASFEAHNGEETCAWADIETHNGRPIAWVGAGSHAAYSRPGQYRLGLDNAQGDGAWLVSPQIEMVTSETPWMQWPGRWGDSGENSPRSPLHQGSKWHDPASWAGSVDDCDMGDPF